MQPIAEIATLIKNRGILFRTDAVQSVGKIETNVNVLGVDFLSLSAHKIYGPNGVGTLYVSKNTTIAPLTFGGGQEHGLRSGTENVAGVVGFGAAYEIARNDLTFGILKIKTLRDLFESLIICEIGSVRINSHPDIRLPHILNVSFADVHGYELVAALSEENIFCSAGAACHAGNSSTAGVLAATQCPPEWAKGAVRFSFGKTNSEEQLDYIITTPKKL